MAEKATIHDSEATHKVEEYQEKRGFESKSKAAKELVEIGFREAEHPTLYRWYERMADVAGLVLVVAVLGLIAGFTGVIDRIDAAYFASASLLFAVSLLALMLVMRVMYGQTELGTLFRGD